MIVGKVVCEKCDVRIPKNRPKLTCNFCTTVKCYKCNNLSKNEALDIINGAGGWMCQVCLHDALPINAITHSKNLNKSETPVSICTACSKNINQTVCTAWCRWCESQCHKSCIMGTLGCKKCCQNMIPGYYCNNYELYGYSYIKTSVIYNPYDQDHLINRLGSDIDAQDEYSAWSDLSEKLLSCKYTRLKHIPETKSGNLRLLSLNIRSLVKNIDRLREDIISLQSKFDVICLSETNCIIEKLPNGLEDLYLDGFHEPIIQAPYRRSG